MTADGYVPTLYKERVPRIIVIGKFQTVPKSLLNCPLHHPFPWDYTSNCIHNYMTNSITYRVTKKKAVKALQENV
jgi:hypothetical protein